MKPVFRIKVCSFTLVLLLLLAVGAAPVMAAGPAQACPAATGSAVKPVIKEMNSNEETLFLEKISGNSNVQKISSELKSQDYTRQKTKGFTVQATDDKGSVSDYQVLIIVYGNSQGDQKSILVVNNEQAGMSTAALVKGDATMKAAGILECFFSAALCLGTCASCGAVCTVEAIESDDGYYCTLCMLLVCASTCGLAICTCADACCQAGNQWCCDNTCA